MNNTKLYDASVIIPVYNQKNSLAVTLTFFNFQTYSHDRFEVIVIDDGSTDNLQQYFEEHLRYGVSYDIRYMRQENKGRAAARNAGVLLANGKRLIFCDADRFPDKNYVKKHIEEGMIGEKIAVIGCPMEFFGKLGILSSEKPNIYMQKIKKYSRAPAYYKKITSVFNAEGFTDSKIVWAAFLVGNSSMDLEEFIKVEKFDEDFKSWGFEHFELALRMQLDGVIFRNSPDILNFHIPHARGIGFYERGLEYSIEMLKKKHEKYNFECFYRFFKGELSLQEFEYQFSGDICKEIRECDSILYKI